MPHPRIPEFSQLTILDGSAAARGFRMPAEWEPLCGVWLVRPFNPETWPGCLDEAQAQWDAFAAALAQVVPVSTTQEVGIETVDSWVRDFGPIFVTDGRGRIAAHDFRFNGWGGKYEDRTADDLVPQHIARLLSVPLWVHDFVLEGGSIEVNGRGTVMTTEQCLLNPNRNPHLSRDEIERRMHEALGTTHTIWLPGGIVGDDTDGHIDDIARFTAPDRVVAVAPPRGHPDHDVLSQNLEALRDARDEDGGRIELIELPAPDPIQYHFPADRFGPGGVNPVPASYANFLIANGSAFVPVFGQSRDDEAVRVLERAFAGTPVTRIVPLRAEHLVVGLGSFHCLSQQQPRA
jgi:agmatine deiminase